TRVTLIMALRASFSSVIRARHYSAIIAWEPAPYIINHSIPPATLELCEDVNNVAFPKAQACLIVGVIVIERSHIKCGRRVRSRSIAVHTRRSKKFSLFERGDVCITIIESL